MQIGNLISRMSWSLEIANGDLAIGGKGLAQVTGGNKLVQDMRCAILTPMGIDDMHPTYGSIIDGGTTPDGVYQQGIIGQQNDQTSAMFVYSELQRIMTAYQQNQISRNANDIATYGRSTLTADEVLLAIENITFTADQTNLLINCTLQTGYGALPLSVPVTQ